MTTLKKTTRKQKTAKASYTAEVQIVASISGDMGEVTLSARDTKLESHAVFSLAESNGFAAGTAEKLLHMARMSRRVTIYPYAKRPTERAVALRYLRAIYPTATPRLLVIESCFTPAGWVKPDANEHCKAFAFYEPALGLTSNKKNLVLRFCVSVHIEEAPSVAGRTP